MPHVLPFRPPERRRLHQDVAEQLRDAILDGRYAAGVRLPPERELAAEFQVNRTSVREAIKVLEGLGLVRVRQGDGAIVQPLADASLSVLPAMVLHGDRLDADLLAELGEVMMPLLLEMGRLAIERHEPRQVSELRRLRDVVADDSLQREERAAGLRDILVLLSDMTGNRVWQMLARKTRSFLAADALRETRSRLRVEPGRLVPAIDDCLAALAAGRRADAVLALHHVIQRVGEHMLQARLAQPASARRAARHRRNP
ncbi:MAG TPA: GntR family transcriptional regulator [Candidatus Binatia bacterium]|nr:GntR family transcriptional regulator [Candidatus Binatia bacterium]